MRHLVRLTDWTRAEIDAVFALADEYSAGNGPRRSGSAVMFFPSSSLRTRVTFERGAHLMGLQPIVCPPDALEKPEALSDVAGYLAPWTAVLVVRHRMEIIEGIAAGSPVPVVNAMSELNHPCEVLSDVYTLGKKRDPRALHYLFVGADGNIAGAWREIATVLGLDLTQCCPRELATPGGDWTDDLAGAIRTADVIITDGPGPHADRLAPFRITADLLDTAPPGAQYAPCPPHVAGREATADAFKHPAFAGHGFKQALLPVHQAVMEFCMSA
ncbi:ornithine carbamoyltransferase [Saccharothrix obliqua]|uniref:ornithine carbamoyltransferase n=1 Tax=Saccharothrix obliqua TaxID=2861747 RepID=UPI001C5CEC86|nr:hypothetical protein [Saccharothrix obliqua]MBW4718530.1 hypothetical protein [Saccharothrix obliqua]